jgi:heptosyltransferase-2
VSPHDATILHDCRHYRGDKPCAFNRLCAGCGEYRPFTHRLAILKIGALGDVIRTLCLLPSLRERHPDAQITWVTSPAAAAFIAPHPLIDRVVPFEPLQAIALTHERFDVLICLDKEPAPCGLAMSIRATRKLGVGLSDVGTPLPLNPEAVGFFQLGLSDDLKFRGNTLSYPRLIHDALGLPYAGHRYELPVVSAAAASVRARLREAGWAPDRPTLGVNVGAGKVFANKMWPAPRIESLLHSLRADRPGWQVLLIGGPEETPTLNALHAALPWTIHTRSDNTAAELTAIIDQTDVLFSGDTLTMHLAIARGRGVVAFFGPTCEQEIDLFGLGEKLVASVPCAPCYKRACDRGDVCLQAVSDSAALRAIQRVMERRLGGAGRLAPLEVRRAG